MGFIFRVFTVSTMFFSLATASHQQSGKLDLGAKRPHGLFCSIQDFVNLCLSNRQRWGHHEPLSEAAARGRTGIEHDAVIEAMDAQALRRRKLQGKPGFGCAICDEFNREQQPLAAYVADDRVPIFEPLESRSQLRTARGRIRT